MPLAMKFSMTALVPSVVALLPVLSIYLVFSSSIVSAKMNSLSHFGVSVNLSKLEFVDVLSVHSDHISVQHMKSLLTPNVLL